jgi:hypothetical protein
MDINKQKLIKDIQNLLNSYDGISHTSINPELLEFMDKKTLLEIIESLLTQKDENSNNVDTKWLEQFKTEI